VTAMRPDDDTPPPANGSPPPLEWAVAGLGLLLVVASLVVLVADALRGGAEAPDPVVQVGKVSPAGGGWVVQVDVRNRTRAPAARLKVRVALRDATAAVEEREIEFDYLPGESLRQGGVFFLADPGKHRIEATPLAYEKP
jgi:uncharacterized protein (TIGR02588 family)